MKKIKIQNIVTNIRKLEIYGCDNLKSVIFENTSGWYLTDYNNNEHTNIDETNKELNATNLVTTYRSKYWKRDE